MNEILSGLEDVAFVNSGMSLGGVHCEKIFEERLHVTPRKGTLRSKVGGLTFEDMDGEAFLIAKDLGPWERVIKENLPRSRFFRHEKEHLQEIVASSSIPSFLTNVALKYRLDREEGRADPRRRGVDDLLRHLPGREDRPS